MKIVKKILIVLLIVLVIAQFFGPDKNESDLEDIKLFLTETNPPKDVLAILETTCYDCHSSNTTYPWYNKITPVNYWTVILKKEKSILICRTGTLIL